MWTTPAWADYDNDGFLDVCVTDGTVFNAQRNAQLLEALGGRPGHVRRPYAIGRRDRAFGQDSAVQHEAAEQKDDLGLEAAVQRSGRWTHEDMAMPVGFDPPLDPGQLGVGQQLGPPSQVEGGLRRLRRQGDGQRCHGRRVALGAR